ncbi:thrombospondin type 3 repeat-containing protein [Candidatus Uhrbacteria bacterium]|nr:thrombospondin type 3 repeat-containing protein [Candidatus Uhrbacteria bacterium]
MIRKYKYLFIASIVLGAVFPFYMLQAKYGDAIGIKVLPNPKRLSPVAWYLSPGNVPHPGKPQSVEIDGYPAIRDGRTVYVGATNLAGQLFANIYLISYNEGADEKTVEIFNQLIKTWKFNTNVGTRIGSDLDAEKLRRDMKRMADINDMLDRLEAYKKINNKYPTLAAGSFKKGLSFSVWPSWEATLANQLGTSLPLDPRNEFVGCDQSSGFEKITCWNAVASEFRCPTQSFVYGYKANDAGTQITLFTNFEYGGPGTWKPNETTTVVTENCAGFGASAAADIDGDGVPNDKDNSPSVYNPDQSDRDHDGKGDVSDICPDDPKNDQDNDGVCANADNCPAIFNPDQKDTDHNGIGDACQVQTCGNGKRESSEECDLLSGVKAHQVCRNDLAGLTKYALQAQYDQTACQLVNLTYCGDGVVQATDNEGVFEACEVGDNQSLSCSYSVGKLSYSGSKSQLCGNDCQWKDVTDCQVNCCNGYNANSKGLCLDGRKPNVDGRCYSPDSSGLCADGNKCTPFKCGNGRVEGNEQCDGNTRVDDCTSTLYAGRCGQNGIMCYGASRLSVCKSDCTWSNWSFCAVSQFCGDGQINGPEDHGQYNNTQSEWHARVDGWRTWAEVSANLASGIKDMRLEGDGCDYGNLNGAFDCNKQYDANGTSSSGGGCLYCGRSCTIRKAPAPFCGDGIINDSKEQCDCPDSTSATCAVGKGTSRSDQYSCTAGPLKQPGSQTITGCRGTGGYRGDGAIEAQYGEECDCGTPGKNACLDDEPEGTNGCIKVPASCDQGLGVEYGLNQCINGKLQLIDDCSVVGP